MKQLTISAENFSAIRENLKEGESVNVNNAITLTGFIANTQYIGNSGKITRTPFYYMDEAGAKYTSTQLKELLNITPETKKERKTHSIFSIIIDALTGVATLTDTEIEQICSILEKERKERKEKERKEKERQKEREKLLKSLTKEQKELLGL